MHAVGVPYRVPTPQDQNSLRVLQYVEKQLAHFNPAGSTSHKCKSCKPVLGILCAGPRSMHASLALYAVSFASLDFLLLYLPWHASLHVAGISEDT